MRFALLSLVDVKSTLFISLLVYQTDENGISNVFAEVAKPYVDMTELIDDLLAYDIDELQTDSAQLYRELVAKQIPVIYRREIEGTKSHVVEHEDILIEVFELDKVDEPTIVLPKWRTWCITKLEKLIQLLKTKGIK